MKNNNLINRLFIISIVCLIIEGCTETNKSDKVIGIRETTSWFTFEAIRVCIEKRQAYNNCIESSGNGCFRPSC